MISYAQNFEDVMLWRALKHIECGFYVDVGANHPTLDSVTKWFYDNGWRGINIEPIEQWFELLEQERPRDINLNIAAGENNGQLTLFEIADTGLSTVNEEFAQKHQQERNFNYSKVVVPQRTLTSICEDYHLAPIHFLKIDVEGAEKQVLQGLDLTQVRPWIVIVEATLPNSQIEDYETWEDKLLQNTYRFVYFDGLNRFYLAEEKEEALGQYFMSPPNVFDGFIPYKQHRAEKELAEKKCSLDTIQTYTTGLEAKVNRLSEENSQLREHQNIIKQRSETLEFSLNNAQQSVSLLSTQIDAFKNSISWRITHPLRVTADAITGILTKVTALVKPKLRRFVKQVISKVLAHAHIATKINTWLIKHFPLIHRHLVRFAVNQGIVPAHKNSYNFVPVTDHGDDIASHEGVDEKDELNIALSPRANEFFSKLDKNTKR